VHPNSLDGLDGGGDEGGAGVAYAFGHRGLWAVVQAELLRVPWGGFNCLRLGEDAEQRQTDYVMLADIFPTGYHATEMAGVKPGDQTVIYGAGLMGGEHTHIAMVEYWRWWVVHLWVEGFFEVFAVAVMSFLFVKLGLVRPRSATANVLFATIVFMAGGVLGTFHHLYFAGTTTAVVALGASFSALEVVPLAFIGMEAYVTRGRRQDRTRDTAHHLVLLARDEAGFKNLMRLSPLAFPEGLHSLPRVDHQILPKYPGGPLAPTEAPGERWG